MQECDANNESGDCIMQIVNHQLIGVTQSPSPNHGGIIIPKILVIHNTGGGTLAGAVNWFSNAKSQVSAHLVMDRDGTVIQCVPFNIKGYHAGVSKWKNYAKNNSVNWCSIGIELVNAGMCGKTAAGQYFDRLAHSITIDNNNIITAPHRNNLKDGVHSWEKYDPRQMRRLIEIARLICRAYQIKEIVGHDDIAPIRKIDPGPAFNMEEFRNAVLG